MMIIILLIKFILLLRIQRKQNINILLKNMRKWIIENDDPNTFIECSNNMQDVYESGEEFNTSRKRKVLVIFDDMVTDMISKNSNWTIH